MSFRAMEGRNEGVLNKIKEAKKGTRSCRKRNK